MTTIRRCVLRLLLVAAVPLMLFMQLVDGWLCRAYDGHSVPLTAREVFLRMWKAA